MPRVSRGVRKNWPIYFKERLWLVNPQKGFIGVVTCWTPKEKIASLMPDRVAVVGQLYTKAGIEFIIRNLWANPRVSCLLICGEDNLKSGEALINFFKKRKTVGVDFLLPNELPKEALKVLKKKVKLVDLRGVTDVKKIIKKIEKTRFIPPFALKPRIFPQAEPPRGAFPSETSVFRVEADTIGVAWLEALKIILKFGWEIPRIHIYGGNERLVLNLSVVIRNEDIKNPKIYRFFQFRKSDLKEYFKSFFTKERGGQAYTYGERLFGQDNGVDQVSLMAKKLQSFPFNKGALAVLWRPEVDNFPKRKPWRTPCLTLVQGICLNGALHLTAYFRSNDMFGAWPLNAFALRKLQSEIATRIKKKVGFLTTISQAAFIDKNDLSSAQKIVDKNKRMFCQWDPRGNLTIDTAGEEIVVRHLSPSGKLLQEFRENAKGSRAATRLIQKLIEAQVISRVDHALDIGEQLGRAEDAIKLGLPFEQDRG